jgi:hypothetical protein
VEEFEILLVDRHVLAEGDRRGPGAADEIAVPEEMRNT